jgi:hypothetical protein
MSTTAAPQVPKCFCMISLPWLGKFLTALYVHIRVLTIRFIAACFQVYIILLLMILLPWSGGHGAVHFGILRFRGLDCFWVAEVVLSLDRD